MTHQLDGAYTAHLQAALCPAQPGKPMQATLARRDGTTTTAPAMTSAAACPFAWRCYVFTGSMMTRAENLNALGDAILGIESL